jgi:hypothetical protein
VLLLLLLLLLLLIVLLRGWAYEAYNVVTGFRLFVILLRAFGCL